MSIVLWAIIFMLFGSMAYAGWSAAPWVPTTKRTKASFVNQLNLLPGQTLFDLGCGDGRVLFSFAKRYPDAHFHGFEISLIPYLIAKLRSCRFPNVHIHFKNLYRANVAQADVVFAFLTPRVYKKLLPNLKNECKPNSLVALAAWPINAPPEQTIRAEKSLPIYLYKAKNVHE